ncbi:YndM family protein [Virgibacillus necropolis]|uniref:YndM family protein n=1 Tax=Virgibacillus necropolis TaxID=163877 RepID=UPI00384BD011
MKIIKHLSAFLIKFIMVTAVLFVVLGLIFGVDFGDVLLISLILTGVSYLGDAFVLPHTSNTVATLADLGLAFFIIWLVGEGVIEEAIPLMIASIISAVVLAVGEVLFHKYMDRNVFEEDVHQGPKKFTAKNFSTEFAEDSPEIKKKNQDSLDEDNNRK